MGFTARRSSFFGLARGHFWVKNDLTRGSLREAAPIGLALKAVEILYPPPPVPLKIILSGSENTSKGRLQGFIQLPNCFHHFHFSPVQKAAWLAAFCYINNSIVPRDFRLMSYGHADNLAIAHSSIIYLMISGCTFTMLFASSSAAFASFTNSAYLFRNVITL